MRVNRDFAAALLAAVAVVLVVVLGFMRIHGPSVQRLVRTDQKRIQNLNQLANEINSQYNQHGKELPLDLNDSQKSKYADPVSRRAPVYTPLPSGSYTLCATFSTDNTKEERDTTFAFWAHPAGSKCFQLSAADPVPVSPYFY